MKTNQVIKLIKKDKFFNTWTIDESTVKLLKDLVVTQKPKDILELGTFLGYGTLQLLITTFPNSKITTVDLMPLFSKYYTKLGPDEKRLVVFKNMDIASFFRSLDSDIKYDLVFIDSDHHFKSTAHDLGLTLLHLKDNAKIVFHDAHLSDFSGVKYVIYLLKIFNVLFFGKLGKVKFIKTVSIANTPAEVAIYSSCSNNASQNYLAGKILYFISKMTLGQKLLGIQELESALKLAKKF